MAIPDWLQYTQSVLFGLVVSFLLAKLFSVIVSFRDENLANPSEHQPKGSEAEFRKKQISSIKNEPVVDRQKSIAAIGNSNSDDDWEGVESTELEKAFSSATAFVAAMAADRSSKKVSKGLQLQLYGLYKIATQGPCSVPQPSAIKMTARAKWSAWHKLGDMSPEEAMHKYLEIITQLCPTWANVSVSKKRDGDSNEQFINDTGRQMGPVFSSFKHDEESKSELKLDAIHAFAREGDIENLLKCIEGGVSVDTKDSEGRTPLHWAVDRGHFNVAEMLLSRNADVNSKDSEGQTPLHYAAVCEKEEIAELLVKRNGGTSIKDDDRNYPCDLSDSNWPWINPT